MPEPTSAPHAPAPPRAAQLDPAFVDALKALEESLHTRDLWNLDPQIFLWQKPVMAGLAVDARLWQKADGHPADILSLIAAQWDDVKASLIAQDPIIFGQPPQAVVLISEAWSLNLGAALDRGEHAKVAEYRQASASRTIHNHPDRQEVRTVQAVDHHLNALTIIRWRGADTVELHGLDGLEGVVPDALKDFISRVTRRRPL